MVICIEYVLINVTRFKTYKTFCNIDLVHDNYQTKSAKMHFSLVRLQIFFGSIFTNFIS